MAGKAVFGSLCAGTFGLGVWQTQRYYEKRDLIRRRQADLEAPPLKTTTTTARDVPSSSFRRVHLRGRYRHDAEFLVGPRGPPPGALPDRPGASAAGMASAPQGYFVLTPFVPYYHDDDGGGKDENDDPPMMIINRGWVPRQMVVSDTRRGGGGGRRPPPASDNDNNNTSQQQQQQQPQPLLEWDRPTPPPSSGKDSVVDVTVVPSTQVEAPRFLVAEHRFDVRPPRFFWFDRHAMREWVSSKTTTNDGRVDTTDDDGQAVRLYTAVAASSDDDSSTTTGRRRPWPAAPPAHAVGEPKTSPSIHAGYAVTWYGLSAAGVYMTRLLLTRGRAR